MNVEDDYKKHLLLQPEGTILEMPYSIGMAMSDTRVFWTLFHGGIYQVETNREVNKLNMIVKRL